MADKRLMNDVVSDIPDYRLSFDVNAFDNALRSQGVRFVHWRQMRCPVGMTDLDDNQRPHPDHEHCTNGFTFTKAGVVTGLFTGNNKRKTPDEIGFWDGSTAQVTLPRFYDESETRVFVSPYDRFYVDEGSETQDFLVSTWQLFIHSESGRDRLKYPVEMVEVLKDNRGEVYYQGEDFRIDRGQIVWTGTRRPAPTLDQGPGYNDGNPTRGAVCGVTYRYRPWYYVGQIVHELRVSQATNEMTGERALQRMPIQLVLHREYVVSTADGREPGAPGTSADDFRTVGQPSDGGFSQR